MLLILLPIHFGIWARHEREVFVINGKAIISVAMAIAVSAAMEARANRNGRALLESRCTHCHEVKTVIALKKTRRQWHSVIVDMRRTGAKVSDAEAAAIVDFLTKKAGK